MNLASRPVPPSVHLSPIIVPSVSAPISLLIFTSTWVSWQLNPLQQHYLLDARASGLGTADTYPELYLGDKEYGLMISQVIANTIDTQLQWSAVPKDEVRHRSLAWLVPRSRRVLLKERSEWPTTSVLQRSSTVRSQKARRMSTRVNPATPFH